MLTMHHVRETYPSAVSLFAGYLSVNFSVDIHLWATPGGQDVSARPYTMDIAHRDGFFAKLEFAHGDDRNLLRLMDRIMFYEYKRSDAIFLRNAISPLPCTMLALEQYRIERYALADFLNARHIDPMPAKNMDQHTHYLTGQFPYTTNWLLPNRERMNTNRPTRKFSEVRRGLLFEDIARSPITNGDLAKRYLSRIRRVIGQKPRAAVELGRCCRIGRAILACREGRWPNSPYRPSLRIRVYEEYVLGYMYAGKGVQKIVAANRSGHAPVGAANTLLDRHQQYVEVRALVAARGWLHSASTCGISLDPARWYNLVALRVRNDYDDYADIAEIANTVNAPRRSLISLPMLPMSELPIDGQEASHDPDKCSQPCALMPTAFDR